VSTRHIVLGVVLVGLLAALAAVVTIEGAFHVVFGWVPFLGRVGPRVTADGPSVLVGVIALGLFAVGVHWLGRAWRPWRARWSVAAVVGVIVLFASGIAVVGIVHQVGWLASADRPLVGEGLADSQSSGDRSRRLGMALANATDTEGALPAGGTFSPNGEMLHSWETALLPFIPYDTSGIDRTRPWTDAVNQPVFKSVVPAFINPGFRTPPLTDADGYGLSHYAANVRVMGANTKLKRDDIRDGMSYTIAFGEVNAGFRPWGHPVNWRDPAAREFGGPPRAGGTWFVMADGSAHFVRDSVRPEVLRAMATPAGGD
jgi:hypothetical protein